MARKGFDFYQSWNNMKEKGKFTWTEEGQTTQKAQENGFYAGRSAIFRKPNK
jgi:hypothetical protein